MRTLTRKQKAVAALAIGALGVAGSGIAYAYWTSDGEGTGTATTSAGDGGNGGFLAVSQVTVLDDMYPGDSEQELVAKVTNNSTDGSSVYVASVKAYLEVSGGPLCDESDYLLNDTESVDDADSAVAMDWTAVDLVTGTNQDTNGTDTIQFNNEAAENQDDCKGASVTIHYLAS